MKNLNAAFLSMILFGSALTASSQELWLDEVDDFTGSVKKGTRSELIGNNGKAGGSTISIFFKVVRIDQHRGFKLHASANIGCAGAQSNFCMLKFSDDTVIRLEDEADIDCADDAKSTFVVTPELRLRIEAKDAPVMIRLQQSDHYTDAKTVDAEMWNAHWEAVDD
jgi:hypothetical protein